MSHTLIIASRELRERSRVFLMAAAMAVLPFIMILIPSTRDNRPEMIAMLAGFLAVALSLGVAIAQGASTIAGELVQRRLSFYFSKPVSPAAVWFGKMIAALLTSFVSFAIIAVPSMLVIGKRWSSTWGSPQLLVWFALAVVVLFLLTHVLSTMVRSHSGLIGIDFLLAAGAVGLILAILKPLFFGAGLEAAIGLLSILGVLVVAILFAAPVWQLAQGRTDLRRSHAALSRALWIPLAVVLLAAGGYVAWLVSVDPDDLTTIHNLQQGSGSAVFVSGTAKGRSDYSPSFIVDTQSGRFAKVDAPSWWGAQFSRDGRVVAWLQATSMVKPMENLELFTRRIDDMNAPSAATGIRVRWPSSFALSNDGSRVAVIEGGTIAVHDLAANRIVASAGLPSSAYSREMYFATPDVLRIAETDPATSRLILSELDTRARRLTETGEVAAPAMTYPTIRTSPDGARIFLPRDGIVADAHSGAVLATLTVTTKNPFATAILRDGSVAIIKDSRLHLFASNGTPARQIALPAQRGWISGEMDGGKLIVGGGRQMFVIDTARGVIERTTKDIRGPAPDYSDSHMRQFRANQPLAALNAEGKLVLWNPSTGAVTAFPSPR